MPNPTPPAWSKDVILMDGTSLHMRPISPEDDEGMLSFLGRLSAATLQSRFMSAVPRFDKKEIQRFTHLDFDNEMAIVGVMTDEEAPERENIVAVGRFVRLPNPVRAEVAFTVEDAYQGQGIGTHLLGELLPFARLAEIELLEAEVLSSNWRMLEVFRNFGFQLSSELQEGTVHIELPLAETELSQEKRWAREQAARAAGIDRIFRPTSVAVVGASARRGTIGNVLMRNLVQTEFSGPVFPVNPGYNVVCSVSCFPSLLDVPQPVDLAVIAVPAEAVLEVIRACVRKRVRAAVIVSAGFGETGPAGKALQDRVLEVARRGGMRLVGPNCLGLLNTEEKLRFNATFAPTYPPAGRVAFSSQSGALGIAILNLAEELQLGLSQFISVGNKADVSGNDLLYFWGKDDQTDVILLYMESFGNPKKFSRIARTVSRTKPIVVLKSGTSSAGARAAQSHTGALASSTVVTRTLMEQAGIVQTDSMERLFHAAKVLGTQPLPAGNRLVILTNAGGPGILSADRAEAEGLAVSALGPSLQEELRAFLPAAASAHNPVDLLASATPEHYERALTTLLRSEEVDQVAVLFIPPMVTSTDAVAEAIIRARQAAPAAKPLVASLMGLRGESAAIGLLEAARVPTFRFPEDAVLALAQLTRYGAWRREPRGRRVAFEGCSTEEATRIVHRAADAAQPAAPAWLPAIDGYRLLDCYGIPTVPTRLATTAGEAAAQAEALGFPVAMKLASRTILHKTDVQGVMLGLKSGREVRGAFGELEEALEAGGRRGEMDGVLLQTMAGRGLEMVLGMIHDPQFGPVLMVGLGGTYLELFSDVQFGLHPVTDRDAARMVERLRSRRLLEGYRGEPAGDVAALQEAILRLSYLVEKHPQVREIDLNPVLVMTQGCRVLDVRVSVAPVDPFEEYVISHLDD